MRKRLRIAVMIFAAAALSACFNITVNVYFPAKDVKSAFKSLEEDLMKGGAEPGTAAPEPEPSGEPGTMPGTSGSLLDIIGPASAYAGPGGQAAELAARVKDDPKVVAAYKRMGERLGYTDRLREDGLAGEGNNGMLVAREKLGKKEKYALDQENSDRNDIIWSMARAIVEINGQPVTNESVSQVLDKAGAEFAAVRRDAAKPGWWVQGEGGSWTRK